MPVSFEFDRRPTTPQRHNNKGRYLRFFILLVIVAVITYAIVCAVVPGKSKNGPENRPAKQGETAGKGDAVETVVTDGGTNGTDNSADGKTLPEKSGNSDDYVKPSAPENNSAGNSSAANDEKKASGVSQASGGKNYKGVVSPSDLPPESDKPAFRKNTLPDVSAQLASLTDPASDGTVNACTDILNKEAAGGGKFSENWLRAGELLGRSRVAVFNSGAWKNKDALDYRVKSGDMLLRIAYRNHTTVEMIKKGNRLRSDAIRIGQRLKLLPGPWKVEISRSARILNLWRKVGDSWRIFAVFPVGVGRENRTPLGTFYISGRLYHPVYSGAEGRKYVYGSPENPLGDCFLKLAGIKGQKRIAGNYGIHGSNDDNSVGRSFSNGCVRMRNRDINFLYYLLPVRTPVEIVD